MQTIIGFATAFVVSLGLLLLIGEPEAAFWTRVVGPMGAGCLAAIMVVMRETLIEDLIKAVIFTVIGGVLLFQGIPPWMAWPVIVGPWAGTVVNSGGGRTLGTRHEPHADGDDPPT